MGARRAPRVDCGSGCRAGRSAPLRAWRPRSARREPWCRAPRGTSRSSSTFAARAPRRPSRSWTATSTTRPSRATTACGSSTGRGPARCATPCARPWPRIPSCGSRPPPRRTRVARGRRSFGSEAPGSRNQALHRDPRRVQRSVDRALVTATHARVEQLAAERRVRLRDRLDVEPTRVAPALRHERPARLPAIHEPREVVAVAARPIPRGEHGADKREPGLLADLAYQSVHRALVLPGTPTGEQPRAGERAAGLPHQEHPAALILDERDGRDARHYGTR